MPIDMVPMCEDHEPFQKSPKSACEICALRDMHADYRSLLMQVHSVFVLLKKEIGELGYGANRVAINVQRVCDGTFKSPKRHRDTPTCICTGGLISMSCPIHSDKDEDSVS